MFIQLILVSVFLLLLIRISRQRSTGKIFKGVASLVIAVACSVVIFPAVTNRIAAIVGVGRGADLIIYLCLAVGAYLMTIVYLQVRRNELQIAKLVQRLAIDSNRLENLELRICEYGQTSRIAADHASDQNNFQ
jgi:hypothetical protein